MIYTMLNANFGIILDLSKDSSDSTGEQLVDFIQKQLNGCHKHNITVLSRDSIESPFPDKKVIVSDNDIDLLFRAKNDLDNANITDIVVVTTLVMKKYWETLCVHMFNFVHNWLVLGVSVTNQACDILVPKLEGVETSIKQYLRTVNNKEEVNILRSKRIPEDKFNAGFPERYGGVTHIATMASLNLLYTVGKPDPLLVIKENQRRLAEAAGFDPESLNVARAEHKTKIWVIGKESPPKYDGVVTNIPGVTVAAPGADCSMVLFADTKTGACGAVHSGWMGTTLGAVRSCLRTMVEEFGTDPKDVLVAIGPTVEAKCFELTREEAITLTQLDPSLTWPVEKHPDHVHTDLVKANVLMLIQEGIPRANIDTDTALCTACNKQFFSHRRDKIPFGNQIGFISCRKM